MRSTSAEHSVQAKAGTKVILTKRSFVPIQKMEYNENGFTSYFVTDALESDKEDNDDEDIVDEEKKLSHHVNRLGSSSYNDSAHRLLHDENASIDSNDVEHDFKLKKANSPKEDIDSVDMALSRDSHKILTDGSIAGYGDQYQQKHHQPKHKKSKYGPKHVKYKVKEKHQSKFASSVKFGWFDMLIGILTIGLFFVDIGTDIEVAVHYFRNAMWVYGGVTTGFIVGPSLVTCFLGLHWYLIDYNKEKEVLEKLEKMGKRAKAYKTPGYVWFLRFFFTLIQCGPVIRVVEYLFCGYRSQCKHLDPRERKRYYRFMLYEDVDSCLLRLFESFLEAAPQLTWQMYIIIDFKPKEDVVGTSLRALALLSSWGSLAISLTSYHKSLRNSHEEKAKMSLKSLPFYFIWRASETGGRVLCIAMFASAFRLWVFGPLAFHWAFMSGWLILQKTTFYKNKCLEKVFNIICGYVMIFCFLNLREGQTRFRFMLFYIILYSENFLMLALWFRFTQDLGAWFHLWGFIVVLILFVFHVVFQLLYYTFFHPTKNIQRCLPCNRKDICSSICYEMRPLADSADATSGQVTIAEVIVENRGSQNVSNG